MKTCSYTVARRSRDVLIDFIALIFHFPWPIFIGDAALILLLSEREYEIEDGDNISGLKCL